MPGEIEEESVENGKKLDLDEDLVPDRKTEYLPLAAHWSASAPTISTFRTHSQQTTRRSSTICSIVILISTITISATVFFTRGAENNEHKDIEVVHSDPFKYSTNTTVEEKKATDSLEEPLDDSTISTVDAEELKTATIIHTEAGWRNENDTTKVFSNADEASNQTGQSTARTEINTDESSTKAMDVTISSEVDTSPSSVSTLDQDHQETRQITTSSTDDDVCLTKSGERCIFPFIYGGLSWQRCVPNGNGAWCPTKVSKTQQYETWNYCDPDQCSVKRF